MGKDRTDLAGASAFSLPEMFTWLGIQQKMIVFPLFGKMCIVFDCFLYEVQLEFKPIQGFKAGHRVRKYDEVGVSATTNEIRGKCNCI